MMATTVNAQTYQNDYKYNFFSNWTVSAAGVYSKTFDFGNFTLGEGSSIGADLMLTKRVSDNWRLRYIAEVPGFISTKEEPDYFDRYGKVLAGASLNIVPALYLFADAGTSYNPSNTGHLLGVACDAGIGVNINTGDRSRFFVELGADRCQNVKETESNSWNSNLIGKIGFAVDLGITEKDRQNLQIRQHQKEQLTKLQDDNNRLVNDLKNCSETNRDLAKALGNSSATVKQLTDELNDCRTNKPVTCAEQLFNIYFDLGSYAIDDTESEKIQIIAKWLVEQGGTYTVHGYCSSEGSDELNNTLSENRAGAVLDELAKEGVPTESMTSVGHGKTSEFGSAPLNRCVRITRN